MTTTVKIKKKKRNKKQKLFSATIGIFLNEKKYTRRNGERDYKRVSVILSLRRVLFHKNLRFGSLRFTCLNTRHV